jgi:hypothetical protein
MVRVGGCHCDGSHLFFYVCLWMEFIMANKADQIRKLLLGNASVKEIAAKVGCSTMYVYNIKHKAKKAFSKNLKKIDKDLGVKSKPQKPNVIYSRPDKKMHVLLFVLGLAVGYIAIEIFSKI